MSEYIPRLREELVSAAARERAGVRRRSGVRLRPVAVAVAVAAAVAVAVVLAVHVPNDETTVAGGAALTYRAVPPGAAGDAAAVLRARIAAARIEGASVTVSGDSIGVDGPVDQIAPLTVPGVLGIYDWEASVLGPDGRPVPRDESVTGGVSPENGAVSRQEAERRASRAAGGAHVVQGANGWYALDDSAAVGNADVASAIGFTEPAMRSPSVAIDLTPSGQQRFHTLTREIAQRGARYATPGESPLDGAQHLAIVLDDRLVSLPFIDYEQAPDGIDGRGGVQIQDDMTLGRAREIAAILSAGPMPADLEPQGA
jgi:hypothetical protein